MKIKTLNQLKAIKESYLLKKERANYVINVCFGAGCVSCDCKDIKDALMESLEKYDHVSKVIVNDTGCIGACYLGPSILVQPGDVYYVKLKPEDIDTIVYEHIVNDNIVKDKCYYDEKKERHLPFMKDIPFFKHQEKIVLKNCGTIDFKELEQYIGNSGYKALGKILLDKKPEDVIKEMKKSGLRGRGGGGFLAGLKWELARKTPSDQKYVICNADEGDPGAFMDRSLLEGDPHAIIEGMAIAGYAIGASKGYVYVRAEYPLAVERLENAIKDAREALLLGDSIFGSNFGFDIEVRIGAGAFVCGEETALINSIEGKRGEPRQKPPFPSDKGLFEKPSIINNVETFGNVPIIIRKGSSWFSQIGTDKSKGTKVFALAGTINNTGIIEVPMGTILGDILFDIGGGIKNDKKFKAAQTGGPSGGCLTKDSLNVPIDYDSLKDLGAIMGSGGLICMDEDNCMVDVARFFMEFVQDESCGKCVPCRLGTRRMLEILENITQGKGKEGDIERLIELGESIQKSALCGLGQTAPNPVLSTIKYFREEYEEHIRDHRCRAGVCQELVKSPCQNACPAGVNVPGYLTLIAAGRERDAYNLIRRENPFPAVCGRVCTHPCESKCRRSQLDQAIAIMDLKRYTADWVMKKAEPMQQLYYPPKGKSIGIIGAGPSGLTCGYYLSCTGYDVTVYEASSMAGGMLALGIPEFRLPNQLLTDEIMLAEQAGVKILLNTEVGKDILFDELKQKHDSIYIATGTHFPNTMGIKGEELKGVYYGIDFLRDVNLGKKVSVGERVAVIGGGSTAMDAARVALRLGAKEVTVLYRRQLEDMPADEREIVEARDEHIKMIPMIHPVEIIGNGKVEGIRCILLESGSFDTSGRRRPVPVTGSEVEYEFDMVIPAVSQHSDLPFIDEDEVEITKWGTFVTDNEGMTKQQGVFAGGDVVRGPDTVIWAIADGKKAASSIDKYLGGTGDLNKGIEVDVPRAQEETDLSEHDRFAIDELDPEKRIHNFDEVNQGFHKLNAIAESMRCLHCDRR
ncbi:MAG: hydrogenase [Firmicutes bacterium HGW-Firmicutes-1]|jgi:NADH-quinone oxidoreductase subunit F|nr:MAG: hydrogenase [Firmicutes bacterium HGW-Firmicutes-1]